MARQPQTTAAEPIAQAQPAVTIQTPSQQYNLTAEEDAKIRAMKTKSEQMRYLSALGWKNGAISKYLSLVYGKTVLYQHVRNVLRQPLKKDEPQS